MPSTEQKFTYFGFFYFEILWSKKFFETKIKIPVDKNY